MNKAGQKNIFSMWPMFVILLFCCCNAKKKQKIDPIEVALNTLQELILKQDPPKGEEFMKIPGPTMNEKVSLSGHQQS